MQLLLLLLVCGVIGNETVPWTEQARSFALGPVAAPFDLRTMLTNHLVRKSCSALDAVAERREAAFREGTWRVWREKIRKLVRADLGELPFGAQGGPLNTRFISRHKRPGYTIENVLFESLSGWDVNASVYLPDEALFPPPWPAVIVSVGHSTKTGESYQKPAQIFARCGYVALTYDPPGMAGEKQGGNDHFSDGARCYATGVSSNRYFIMDGLRSIDYLASRQDVDLQRGIAATGVSGGGFTTMFMTLLDDRIAVSGPSCCAVSKAAHPVLDAYAECPEVLPFNRFNEYDDVDMLVAALPAAVLLMAGKDDEVFTESMSRNIAGRVAANFIAADAGDRFALFLDNSGHAYTPAMALEFVRWMNRWLLNDANRAVPEVAPESLEVLDKTYLTCAPRQDRTIYAENCDVAAHLRESRPPLDISILREAIGIEDGEAAGARTGVPVRSWGHYVQEVLLLPEPDIALPATFMYPVDEGRRSDGILYFDDRGRWTDLRAQGRAAGWAGFLGEEDDARTLLSVDLRGWGDTVPADLPYDLAGWGSRNRWIAYISAGLGDSIMAMRVRDGLAAYQWLQAQPGMKQIVVGGRGLGAVVALHVANLAPDIAGVFCDEMPESIERLVAEKEGLWTPDAFFPEMLRWYDLPELIALTPVPVLLHNMQDARKQSISNKTARELYSKTLAQNPRCQIPDHGDIASFVKTLFQH